MKKKLKIGGFAIGLIVLFLILQYDFTDDDSWDSWNLPLTGKIILLDPGHGGPDGGAGDEGALEKDIALDVSLKVRDYLQEQGALVLMTREEDRDLAPEGTRGYSRRKVEDLKKRLEMINTSNSDFYVSIHLNSIPSPRWSGAQTFYAPGIKENTKAAKFIQDELRRNLENTKRNSKPLNNVFILKYAKKPGVLVEVGFLSNPGERANLKTDEYQDKIAASIYNGIMRYYTNEKELTETWE
ncbi:N-acetylmuramoyl-L-alanine amidase CwlD [Cytobacillus oceanisediminis]|uniref:N-acetylmuramoyl-L-alanine amidase CwlD n=1 Tax=Cytobacillus oceanisediminis TaxID=665099 RepID=UPI00203F5057|nr:N-acetylmuramoyl-L-alanine amidase CwlD [Cytobacillus oceanisediminis]MCM3405534.1 N-acetylmuramoyl-L-alanine amidase CwlD [Cytobacillus oceanisediminis]MDK7669110.1 N-acetylmuramoyl-L-alanine amidase CwlD [Cytobacillus oceanisediminis]